VYFVTTNSPEVEKGWCPMGSMHVFEKNKGDYTRGTDAGNGLSKLELAKAMLRFIATPADPINEGLHYVGEAIDPEVLDKARTPRAGNST
jgi:hypothetical protein